MIEARNITKKFGSVAALDDVSCKIDDGSIYGLVGSNGAGKSTFLRLLAGILRPDKGYLMIDNQLVYDNPMIKSRLFFAADQPFFPHPSSVEETVRFYRMFYPKFSDDLYKRLSRQFPVDTRLRFSQMSKGMQRQVVLMIAFSCQPDYLLLDESFDGLDPVVRQLLKRLLADSVAERNLTILIASHNLRELEDICDHIGLLHQGGILFEQELDAAKLGIQKVQAVFTSPVTCQDFPELNILKCKTRGTLVDMVIRGQADDVLASLRARNPSFLETLPLTLEEVFIQELEVAGYDVNTFLN